MLRFITKSGFEMVDAATPYGVAELITLASRLGTTHGDVPVQIRDLGYAWHIQGPDLQISQELAEKVTAEITAPLKTTSERGDDTPSPAWFLSRGWNYLHTTIRGEDSKGKSLQRLQEILPRVLASLAGHRGLEDPELKTLEPVAIPQALETAGGKGSRAPSRATYGESQSEIPAHLWAIATVGAMAVGTFLWPGKKAGQGYLLAVPLPTDVLYLGHLEIRDQLRESGELCRVSTITAVAHFAVKIARAQAQRQVDSSGWANRYSAVVFEGMVGTGQQTKPTHGGMFPMDALNDLIGDTRDTAAAAHEVFETWDRLLQNAGRTTGLETLALSLAEFLMHPTLPNLDRHWRTHLRFALRDKTDKKRVTVTYPESAMKGLMAHVRV